MSENLRTSNLFTVEAGQKLLGEIITWEIEPGTTVLYADVVDALIIAGLDQSVAKELSPSDAFTRACQKLKKDRIISELIRGPETIIFQFNKRQRSGEEFEYPLETKLSLDRKTGLVSCAIAELTKEAQSELNHAITARTANDISRITQTLFANNADLFPIKKKGGVYFVPAKFSDFLAKIEVFLRKISGEMNRLPIAAGTAHGDRSVKDAVKNGLDDALTTLAEAVTGFDDTTRHDTFERAAQRIREAKFKVEAYSEYLGAEKERLAQSVEELNAKLRAKVEELSADKTETPEPATAGV